jgi:hypothetical protein
MAALPLLFLLTSATVPPKGWQQLGPGHFLCSEPAGDFDNYEIPPLQPDKALTIRFKLVSENYDPKWTVNAAVFFDSPTGRFRITVGKAQNERDHIYVALLGPGMGSTDWALLGGFPVTTSWIDVNLKMDARGTVRVRSHQKNGKLLLGTTQPVKTLLHCHSGVFEIELVPPAQG